MKMEEKQKEEDERWSRPITSSFGNTTPLAPFLALALFDFMPDKTDENELAFVKGDIVTVLETHPSGWWKGEYSGNFGWVPSEFVRPLELLPPDDPGRPSPALMKRLSALLVQPLTDPSSASRDGGQNGDDVKYEINPVSPGPVYAIHSTHPHPSTPPVLRRMSPTNSKVIKTGYLQKKGAKRRNWTRRWFVLRGSTLEYFQNEKSEKKKGSIGLEMAVVATSQRKPFCFFVRTPQRILMMWPDSREERDSWIEAIKQGVTTQYGEDPPAPPPVLAVSSSPSPALSMGINVNNNNNDGGSASPKTALSSRSAILLASESVITPKPKDFEGFLMKKGQKRRNWTKRWFCLKGGHITYFVDERKKQQKGEIHMDSTTSICETTIKSYGFFIENKERKIILCAQNEQERQQWLSALRLCVRSFKVLNAH